MNSSKNKWYSYLYVKDSNLLLLAIIIQLIIASVLGFFTPRMISQLYEAFNSQTQIKASMLALAGIFIGEYLNTAAYQFFINLYVRKLIFQVRSYSYSRWILSYEAVGEDSSHQYPLGEVLARLINDTEALMELITTGSFRILIDFSFIISCLISFMSLNTTAGAFLAGAELLAAICLVYASRSMGKVFMEVRKSLGSLSRVMADLIAGVRSTFYTPHHHYALRRATIAADDFLTKQLKSNIWDAGYYSIAESLFPVMLALLVMVFPYTQITEIAILAAIIDLIQRSISPIKEVASKISSMQRAKTGLTRIMEFNSHLLAGPMSEKSNKFTEIQLKSFSFELGRFSYPARGEEKAFGLADIKFQAKAGELVGIVGLSGSGKSTLLKILSSDIVATTAKVELKALDGKHFTFRGGKLDDLSEYKRQVSIVTQDSHVFSESLAFNITMGVIDDINDLQNFWQHVQKDIPYLRRWGVSLETMISPSDLSLGQKQLISALRSCYLRKPIVLFDEISSALDSELEAALRKMVLVIQEKSLTFIVAHRLETIINADQILLMQHGRLVANGTHQELFGQQKLYQSFIAELQDHL